MSNGSPETELQRLLQAAIDSSRKWQRRFWLLSIVWLLAAIGVSLMFWSSAREFDSTKIKYNEAASKLPEELKSVVEGQKSNSEKIEKLEDDVRALTKPLPVPLTDDAASFPRLSLDRVEGAPPSQVIEQSGKLVFHVAGNTGGVIDPKFQIRVANAMVRQFEVPKAERPAFLYLLGNIVYYHGEASEYPNQFYKPYQYYPRPIFAIPGNHDNEAPAFRGNFCSPSPGHTAEAGAAMRKSMTQPNVYWTLETTYATIIGLYTGVLRGGNIDDVQKSWLIKEIKNAPPDKAIIITMHHSVFTGALVSETPAKDETTMGRLLDDAVKVGGRDPDLVLSAHAHVYLRYMRERAKREVPYVVAGTGGYFKLQKLRKNPQEATPADVVLKKCDDAHHGFLRITVTKGNIVGEYFRLESDSGADGDRPVLWDRFEVEFATKRL